MALLWKSCFLKYGTFMKPTLLLLSSQNTILTKVIFYFWKWHFFLEAQLNLNTTTDQKHEVEYLRKKQIKRNRKKIKENKRKVFIKQHISEEFSPSVAIIRFRSFFFVQIHSSSLSPVPQSQSAMQK